MIRNLLTPETFSRLLFSPGRRFVSRLEAVEFLLRFEVPRDEIGEQLELLSRLPGVSNFERSFVLSCFDSRRPFDPEAVSIAPDCDRCGATMIREGWEWKCPILEPAPDPVRTIYLPDPSSFRDTIAEADSSSPKWLRDLKHLVETSPEPEEVA